MSKQKDTSKQGEIVNDNPSGPEILGMVDTNGEIHTTDEVKKTSDEGEILEKIDPKKIHTVFYIKNGVLHKGDVISELSKKNYKYRLYSLIEGIALIDYDKTDARPLVKDILNRTGEFLEIKLLKREFWILIAIISLILICVWRVFYIQTTDISPVAK